MLPAEDVVGPLDGDFADAGVALPLGVGVVLESLENFCEGKCCHLRNLWRRGERDSVQRNQDVEVEVETGRGVPGAFVASASCGLRVGDHQGSGGNISGCGADLH